MWNEQFRLSEAAELIGISFTVLKGWRQRGLIKMASRDRTRPGHPHCVSLAELIRLATAAQIQRLSKVAFDTNWNPGPFLKTFRKSVTDNELQHTPIGSSPEGGVDPWIDDDDVLAKMNADTVDRRDDLLMIINSSGDRGSAQGKAIRLISLERFRKVVNGHRLGENAYLLVNISDVLRRLAARYDEICARREGRRILSEGWKLPPGFTPERRQR
jgi:hypothetical protein